MDDRQPTPAQARVLAAIERRLELGEPVPSYRDLCQEFGWSSTGTVRDHLRALKKKGYVDLSGPGHRQVRLRGERVATARLPIVGRIVAGTPVLAQENIEGHMPIPAEWTRGRACFVLRVRGDSMIDAGIHEGDHVVVQQQATAEDGDIVVATLDMETTLKRFQRTGRRIVLAPENARYRPIVVRTGNLIIQGIVVGLMRAYRRSAGAGWKPQFVLGGSTFRVRRRRATST